MTGHRRSGTTALAVVHALSAGLAATVIRSEPRRVPRLPLIAVAGIITDAAVRRLCDSDVPVLHAYGSGALTYLPRRPGPPGRAAPTARRCGRQRA